MGQSHLPENLRDRVIRIFRQHGVVGAPRLGDWSADEVIFVVSSVQAADMQDGSLTRELSQALGRKVWITTSWPHEPGPL
jgi:hypothetical protein